MTPSAIVLQCKVTIFFRYNNVLRRKVNVIDEKIGLMMNFCRQTFVPLLYCILFNENCMKGRTLLLTAIPTLVVAVIMLITYDRILSEGVVIAAGILFILMGVLNVISYEDDRRRGNVKPSVWAAVLSRLTSAAAIILGLSMVVFRDTFTSMVPFIFGMLACFGALHQLYLLARGSWPVKLPVWLYAAPAALVGCATYLFMADVEADDADAAIMLTTAIALAVFGVATVIEAWLMRAAGRKSAAAAAGAAAIGATSAQQPRALDDNGN